MTLISTRYEPSPKGIFEKTLTAAQLTSIFNMHDRTVNIVNINYCNFCLILLKKRLLEDFFGMSYYNEHEVNSKHFHL